MKSYTEFLNELKKEQGQDYDFADINVGDKVAYSGTRYYVIYVDEYIMELSKDPEAIPNSPENLLVNRNMFAQQGIIS